MAPMSAFWGQPVTEDTCCGCSWCWTDRSSSTECAANCCSAATHHPTVYPTLRETGKEFSARVSVDMTDIPFSARKWANLAVRPCALRSVFVDSFLGRVGLGLRIPRTLVLKAPPRRRPSMRLLGRDGKSEDSESPTFPGQAVRRVARRFR